MSILNQLRRGKLIVFLGVIAFSVSACTTVGNIHKFRGKGIRQVYQGSFIDVFEAGKEAAMIQGLTIKEENMDGRYIIAGHGVSLMSWGELVAIYFVSNPEDTETAIEIISKAKMRTNVFAPKWEDDYLRTVHGIIQ